LVNRIPLEGIETLDLFGGTGNISYELASRGAAQLTIVEKDPVMCQFIRNNLDLLGIKDAQLIKSDVFTFLDQCESKFDFIFAGPPYALQAIDLIPEKIIKNKLLSDEGLFVLEHTLRNNYKECAGFIMQRNYGTTLFSFFENKL
jgi:16S rRNA (guanine(966)-N(2))-methyltransferase RsmD